MSFCKIVQDSGFPFVGYTFDDDGKLYCKTCGAESKREHSSVCPQVRHWPTRKQIRAANHPSSAVTRSGIGCNALCTPSMGIR